MPTKIDISKVSEPDWLKKIPPNAFLNHKDICDILKINTSTLYNKIAKGEFPEPDTTHLIGRTLGKGNVYTNKRLWKVATFRKFLKGDSNENL
jgi:hypothetical protein